LLALSHRVPRPRASTAERRPRARAFARIEIYRDFAAAADAWAEIDARTSVSPYQSLGFARAWGETIGEKTGVAPLIVVARDEAGEVTALLPLGVFRRGAFRVATLLGGRLANYQMGLFRDDVEWPREAVEDLLRAIAAEARPRIDLFTFSCQPLTWRGAVNPLAAFPRQPSPSDAFASALPPNHEAWLEAHFSKSSLKKWRKKWRKLEAIGPVSAQRARAPEEIREVLGAFLAQKRGRARALRMPSEFDRGPEIAMLERLAADALMELHALRVGGRIIAVFGGLADAHRLHGLVLSFDAAHDVAPSSPGEQLVIEMARDAIARGFSEFDLGVGEARYKNECCERTEPLFDIAFPITPLGRLGATAFLGLRRVKKRVKQSPRLYALALRLQRWLG
jgi:CelD/BcsL family acetyltransferase involved in cellulose biosynthesis